MKVNKGDADKSMSIKRVVAKEAQEVCLDLMRARVRCTFAASFNMPLLQAA
ncbi:hypothetical protein SAMN06295970_106126 [Noviherbaspirillum suwonense]|uniref:Transposase n=1 Tax=Noviherbaspirillum suwonense TaxID=1224511 RepID=A0ABY1Q5W9_9BURK|nr:hypothetical protein SAMN06295970_106126 [Noviherbaspirillum suwonense]